jgi:hypothetical protein
LVYVFLAWFNRAIPGVSHYSWLAVYVLFFLYTALFPFAFVIEFFMDRFRGGRTYAVSKYGPRMGSGAPMNWGILRAFDIEPAKAPMTTDRLVFISHRGQRFTSIPIPIPEDVRIQAVLLRYIRRFIPPLEETDLVIKPKRENIPMPGWWICWMLILTSGWATAVGLYARLNIPIPLGPMPASVK